MWKQKSNNNVLSPLEVYIDMMDKSYSQFIFIFILEFSTIFVSIIWFFFGLLFFVSFQKGRFLCHCEPFWLQMSCNCEINLYSLKKIRIDIRSLIWTLQSILAISFHFLCCLYMVMSFKSFVQTRV
jgi:hypothetical protein